MFEDYRYISPLDGDTPDAPIPHGYDQYGSVSFGINLATLLSCLNMFGTANTGSYNNDSIVNFGGGGGSGGGVGSVTPVKLSYNGIGSKFTLM